MNWWDSSRFGPPSPQRPEWFAPGRKLSLAERFDPPRPLVAEAALKRLAAAAHFEQSEKLGECEKNSGNSRQCNNVCIYIHIYWLLANNCIYIVIMQCLLLAYSF